MSKKCRKVNKKVLYCSLIGSCLITFPLIAGVMTANKENNINNSISNNPIIFNDNNMSPNNPNISIAKAKLIEDNIIKEDGINTSKYLDVGQYYFKKNGELVVPYLEDVDNKSKNYLLKVSEIKEFNLLDKSILKDKNVIDYQKKQKEDYLKFVSSLFNDKINKEFKLNDSQRMLINYFVPDFKLNSNEKIFLNKFIGDLYDGIVSNSLDNLSFNSMNKLNEISFIKGINLNKEINEYILSVNNGKNINSLYENSFKYMNLKSKNLSYQSIVAVNQNWNGNIPSQPSSNIIPPPSSVNSPNVNSFNLQNVIDQISWAENTNKIIAWTLSSISIALALISWFFFPSLKDITFCLISLGLLVAEIYIEDEYKNKIISDFSEGFSAGSLLKNINCTNFKKVIVKNNNLSWYKNIKKGIQGLYVSQKALSATSIVLFATQTIIDLVSFAFSIAMNFI